MGSEQCKWTEYAKEHTTWRLGEGPHMALKRVCRRGYTGQVQLVIESSKLGTQFSFDLPSKKGFLG